MTACRLVVGVVGTLGSVAGVVFCVCTTTDAAVTGTKAGIGIATGGAVTGPGVGGRLAKPGASVTLTRNHDYWGRDLPVNRGLWNFDEVRLDFYREANG